MDYQGPETADLQNVHALNTAFLEWLAGEDKSRALPAEVPLLFAGLDQRKLARLARVPFMLLSLREYDEAYWRTLFAARQNMSLLSGMQKPDAAGSRLTIAALGFLWQLASRNPYAARLVSGASLDWCEQLAACTLMELIGRVAEEPSLLEPRMSADTELWNKLLTSGVSGKRDVRMAARVSALQSVLTGAAHSGNRQFATAACQLPAARMRVADDRQR
jgi:hypothetical protein